MSSPHGGFHDELAACRAQGGGDAGEVQQARVEEVVPVDAVGAHADGGGISAVVGNLRGVRGRGVLDEVQALAGAICAADGVHDDVRFALPAQYEIPE